MALKARVENLEGMDEGTAALYRQDGDAFILDVEGTGGWALEDVAGLRSALQTERKVSKEAQDLLKAYKIEGGEYLDPKKALEAMEKAEEFAKLDPEKEADKIAAKKIEDARTVINAQWQEKEQSWEKEKAGLLSAASRLALNTAVDLAIDDEEVRGIGKALKPVLVPHVGVKQNEAGEFVTYVKDPNDPTQARLNGSGQDMTVRELAVELKKDKDLSGLFRPPERKGEPPAAPHRPNAKPSTGAEPTGAARIARGLQERNL